MNATIQNSIAAIASETDRAFATSDAIFRQIKELKKSVMKHHLSVDENADTLEEYKSAFSSSSWDTVQLKDLVPLDGIIEGPGDESFYADSYSQTGVPIIVPGHIKKMRFLPETITHISNNAVSRYKEYVVRGGDIIIRYDNEDKGAGAIIPFMNEESVLGSHIVGVSLKKNCCEAFYILNVLHFYYNTGIIKKIIDEPAAHSISEMIIPLPPLEKQKHIARTMLQLSAGMMAQENYHREMRAFGPIEELLSTL